METVIITVDDQIYESPASLSTTLHGFLSQQGLEIGGMLFDQQGKPVVTRFTLVHSVQGGVFTSQGAVAEEVPALTLDQLLTTTGSI
ncbi:MAG: hypothetical protein WC314_19830 [Vulcanimicrobiota bacterium]